MSGKIVALCGGVGGAKLAVGLASVMRPEDVTIIVNTGDDFEHIGLYISPDIDTVMYSLAGMSDPVRGWGLKGETWSFMHSLSGLNGDNWFLLGDRDLATHVLRSYHLRRGNSLTNVTAELCRALGVRSTVVPMSDDPVRTILQTDHGRLAFQDYFVRQKAVPSVRAITYEGAETATPSPDALAALNDPNVELIILCPSNPWLSIAPLLSVPALRNAIATTSKPVVAVSPLIAGTAVKGPTAKIMHELGLDVTAKTVVDFYGDLVHGHVLDYSHAHEAAQVRHNNYSISVTHTLMTDLQSKSNLANHVVNFGRTLRAKNPRS